MMTAPGEVPRGVRGRTAPARPGAGRVDMPAACGHGPGRGAGRPAWGGGRTPAYAATAVPVTVQGEVVRRRPSQPPRSRRTRVGPTPRRRRGGRRTRPPRCHARLPLWSWTTAGRRGHPTRSWPVDDGSRNLSRAIQISYNTNQRSSQGPLPESGAKDPRSATPKSAGEHPAATVPDPRRLTPSGALSPARTRRARRARGRLPSR